MVCVVRIKNWLRPLCGKILLLIGMVGALQILVWMYFYSSHNLLTDKEIDIDVGYTNWITLKHQPKNSKVSFLTEPLNLGVADVSRVKPPQQDNKPSSNTTTATAELYYSSKLTTPKTDESKILAGGVFSLSDREMRVNGISATTRGLGNHGDPKLKSLVTYEPSCITVPIDQYAQFVILASHGVWEVLSPKEAAELLLQILPVNQIPTPGYISPSIEKLQGKNYVPENAEELDEELPTFPEDGDDAEEKDNKLLLSMPSAHNENRHSAQSSLPMSARPMNSRGSTKLGVSVTQNVSFGPLQETPNLDSALYGELDDRSMDSGNEADVDTDWASTVAPYDLAERALSSRQSIEQHFSKLMAERLVQCSLIAGAKDNISVVVLLLPGSKVVG